jgi:hypothetical protein
MFALITAPGYFIQRHSSRSKASHAKFCIQVDEAESEFVSFPRNTYIRMKM